MALDYKYWAFVSYAHADETWARWLHASIERYVVPRALVGQPTPNGSRPRRLIPIFRDRDELASSGDLPTEVHEALQQSRFLIVVCSPKAAVSRWVNEEIRNFRLLGRDDRVLALIIDGEPNASDAPESGLLEAFPRALRFRVGPDGELTSERAEPLAADARRQGDGRYRALLKLLAGMLDVGFDELVQREKRRRVRRMIAVGAAAVLTIAALTAFWFNRQRAIGRQQRINFAQALANEALQRRTAIDPSLSALLAVESLRIAATTDGVSAALASMALVPRRLREFRHADRVTVLSFAADGTTLVSGATTGAGPGNRSTIRVWDLAAARQLSEVVQDEVVPQGWLAIDSDHTLLAIVSPPGGVRVSDLRTGAVRYHLQHEPSISSVMFGTSHPWIATSGGGKFRMWNAATGTLLEQFSGVAGSTAAFAAAVSEDESRIATSASDTVVWNGDTGATVARLPHAARHLAFVGNDRLLTANEDSAQLWDLSASSTLGRLDYRQRFGGAAVVALSPVRTRLAAASGNTVSVWDVSTGREIGRVPHTSFVTGLAFSHDGARLATGSDDGVVTVWEAAPTTGNVLGHEGRVFAFSMTADGSRVATAGEDGVVVWDASTARPVVNPFGKGTLSTETLSSDGRLLAAARGGIGDEPDTVIVTDAGTGKERSRLSHPAAVRRMTFSADGRLLVTQSGNTITFWQMLTGQKVRSFESDDIVESFGMSPDGQRLAIASGNTTDMWNAQTGQKTSTLSFKALVRSIAFSADSALLATMSGSGVRVWDANTGQQRIGLVHDDVVQGVSFDSVDHDIVTFSGREANIWRQATTDRLRIPHDEDVVAGAFDSTGQHLATLTNSAVHLWDATAGRKIARLPVDEELTSVTFSANDRFVVAGGGGRFVRVFPWRADDLMTDVCSRLTHNMTPSEWSTYFREQPYRPTCPNVSAPTRR